MTGSQKYPAGAPNETAPEWLPYNAPAMRLAPASVLLVILSALLGGCAPPSENAEPPHQDWVIESRVVFKGDRPKERLRIWAPYIVGDLWGSPNAGEITPVNLRPDLAFTLNLNLGYTKLERALIPTEFSQRWMNLEPKDARIARVMPFVLPFDGIAPFGTPEWLDADTNQRLMLIYLDRPSRLRGEVVYEGRSLRFDIDATEAGYLWVTQPEPEKSGEYRVVPRPKNLVLEIL